MATDMVALETQILKDMFLTLQARGLFKESLAAHSRQLLALRLYQERTLSLGKAARLAGISQWEFIDFLSDNNMPVIDHSEEELITEFETGGKLAGDLGK